MKLDNLLLLAGGGFLLYQYMQKKNASTTQLGTQLTTEEILEEYFYTNDEDATPPDVLGCMNEEASNYNPLATSPYGDTLEGCVFAQDDSAQGEDPLPPIILGCTDGMATNYNPMADQDDGSCYFEPIVDTEITLIPNDDILIDAENLSDTNKG